MSLTRAQVDAPAEVLGECRIWTRALSGAGYGVLRDGKKLVYAHRVAYEHEVGPIPEGLELDHLCRNRACYNPHHLEPVTHAENMRRGYWGRKTHCLRGHAYDEANTVVGKAGGRECRTCRNARRRALRKVLNPQDLHPRARTHCPKGHPLSGENLYRYPDGRRGCRDCKRVQARESYLRMKAAS